MTLTLNRTHILFFFSLFWLFFISVLDTTFHESSLFAALSVVSLLIVPGALTTMILRIQNLDFWTYFYLAIGFSILELLIVGLMGNSILYVLGVDRPLDRSILISEFSIFVAALIALAWVQVDELHTTLKTFLFTDSMRDFALASFPVLLIGASVFGANLLNNGGSNTLTLVMLICAALYSGLLLWYSSDSEDDAIAFGLFGLSLALLLMTSLRGFHVTGHDIQREYEVFQITKQSGLWSIAHLRDAYNACLSITILPTILSSLSNISDPYIYKVVFQMLFATVPGMLYLFVRRYVARTLALITALYFVSFPTFFMDMPFLNRQEIAFLFLFLMFLIISDERLSLFKRRILFILFGLGMVLSHYSTTYTVVALLLFATLGGPIFSFVGQLLSRFKIFSSSGVMTFHKNMQAGARITIIMTFALAAASFLWSSVLTDTSHNSISRVISETISVIMSPGKDETRSSDVAYGLFSRRPPDTAELLRGYNTNIATVLRAQEPAGTYFSDTVLASHAVRPAAPPQMPLTQFGKLLEESGVDIHIFNTLVRQSSAKLLQVFILIGIITIVFTRRYPTKPLDTEYILLAFGSLCMLIAIIILPVLSAEYGLLRAFQQSLLFLGVFIVIGNLIFLSKAGTKIALSCSAALAILFMLSSTGVFTQALGGYEAQLHLNNAGTYYDLYYMHRGDIVGTSWLLQEMHARGIYGYQSGLAVDVTSFLSPAPLEGGASLTGRDLTDGVDVFKNIYPSLVRTRSYVLVGEATLKHERAMVIYNSDVLAYQYPLNFLDENKDLLYSNGSVGVYR